MILTITAVEEKKAKKTGNIYYSADTDHGKFSSSEDLRPYIGKSADFITANSQDGQHSYINKPLPAVPQEKAQDNPFLDSKESNTILMKAADLVVARLTAGQQGNASNIDLAKDVLDIYDRIMSGLKAARMPEEGEIPF